MADRRVSRQFQLLLLLRARESISAAELAERLDVNVRTIYRDVEDLLQSGVPIQGVPGPEGGYRIRPEAAIEPTVFDSEDAFKLYLLQLSRGARPESTAVASADNADADARELARMLLDGKVYFDPTDTYWRDEGSGLVSVLTKALTKSEAVLVAWLKGAVEQVIMPLGLVWKAGHWYLIARDLDGRIFRERLINFSRIRLTGLSFDVPEGFRLDEWWKSEIARFGSGDIRVTFSADPTAALELRKLNRKDDSVFKDLPNGGLRVTLFVDSWQWLVPLLASYGPAVTVEEPIELRSELLRFFEAAATAYRVATSTTGETYSSIEPPQPAGDSRLRSTRGRISIQE